MYNNIVKFIKKTYNTDDFILLHGPCFLGNEKEYINQCIDTTMVSSVGKFVNQFEEKIAQYTGSKYAVATMNGTAALHIALILADVAAQDEVITQPLTFIATANAISYTGAKPVFIDVDKSTMGLSPEKLLDFLKNTTYQLEDNTGIYTCNRLTHRKIKACVPMHTFGHAARIEELKEICDKYHIKLIEDAAEALGSFYKNKHLGTFGETGIISFNGNKILTTGGGGMLITNNEKLARHAKHLTTQAKKTHKWEYKHDYIGYNYRLTNLQAALGVAQMEKFSLVLEKKRALAQIYQEYFNSINIPFVQEPANAKSNYWLNAIILKNKTEQNRFLEITNKNNVMTRPIWELMNRLPMFKNCQADNLENSEWFADRIVNIPSSIII